MMAPLLAISTTLFNIFRMIINTSYRRQLQLLLSPELAKLSFPVQTMKAD